MADTIRLLALALGGLDIGYAVVVMVLYARITRQIGGTAGRELGALPRHVWSIAAAHVVLILALMIAIGSRLGEPVGWSSVLGVFGFGLTAYALHQMLVFQRARARFRDGMAMVELNGDL